VRIWYILAGEIPTSVATAMHEMIVIIIIIIVVVVIVVVVDMIHLLTAIGLTSSGSSTVHIYTQTI